MDIDRSYSKVSDYKLNYLNKPKESPAYNERIAASADKKPTYLNKDVNRYEPSSGKSTEIKTQLEQSRNALSVMKSELQAKLTELSTKTTMSSALKKSNHDNIEQRPSTEIKKEDKSYSYSVQKSSGSKLSSNENQMYEEITSKYSKMNSKCTK